MPTGVPVTGPIVQYPSGAYNTAFANLIQGGCWQVADSTARNAIPIWGQVLGLLVVLQSDGSLWEQTTYPLTGMDGDWTEVVSGSLTLTTTGSSGAATLIDGVLNIPEYSGGGSSGTVTEVDTDATLTGGPITTTGTLGIATSAALPGSPTTTTQSALDDSTKIATTAYVDAAVGVLAAAVVAEDYLTANQTITLSSDATGSGTTAITVTLATVNSNVGSFGSSTAIPSVTVNAKGLVTAASTSVVIAPAGTLSGTTLNATVVTSSLTAVGTIATGVWQGTPVTVAYGGTGDSSLTAYAVLCGGTTSTGALQQVSGLGTSGYVLTSNGAGALPTWQATGAGSGTVTTVSVVSTNGFAGTVANATSTPAITMECTITGILKGNGTAISAATPGTDYLTSTVTALPDLVEVATIGIGTWEATTIVVAYGGTGSDTLTAHAVLLGEGTSAIGFATIGTAGRLLTDQGSGTDPLFSSTGLVVTQHSGAIHTDTPSAGAVTCDLSVSDSHKITLAADTTFTFSNPPASGFKQVLVLQVIQGGSGSYTATWPGSVDWGSAGAPTLSTTVSDMDILVFYWDGSTSTYYGSVFGLGY